jgi:methylmalonyl-CoA mutase C-terminal domain/subunit
MMKDNKQRVMIAKIGLDGHDRGAKVVARALRDAGMEVIYTGIRQKIEDIVTLAVDNEVNVLGLSFLSGDHMTMVPKIKAQLQKAKQPDLPIIVGGIILQHQIPKLTEMGVQRVFLAGTPLEEIIDFVGTI